MFLAIRKNQNRVHLGLMLSLTMSTGLIDAVGYLGLDRVFTGNMTGNVVILGMALVGADNLPIIGPVVALFGFVVGAAIAGRVLRSVAAGWTHHSTALFGVVGVILIITTVALAIIGEVHPAPVQFAATGSLGLAMGIQAGTARHIAVKDVTTVVVTSTLTGLAADSRFGGAKKQMWQRRLGAVVLIGLGAAIGAAAIQVHLSLGLAISAFITLGVALIGSIGASSTKDPTVATAVRF
ncbi:DUF1275 domain-containing protein [Cryobacterium algoritolerans]|uniref:DUF1275 domain-containing protein n=2 Tax=Cryobacterium algoritolerans TaxID=1259184 RepID=A0A4R8WTU6_9MICO|nr:DUF1275 domain-containing protein [Cryobacterium algoritolerans]